MTAQRAGCSSVTTRTSRSTNSPPPDARTIARSSRTAARPPQEAAAARAEPGDPAPSRKRLLDLRDQINRLKLTLSALPTRSLQRFDELEVRARDLTAQRTEHHERLAGLALPSRRLGRLRAPDADERALLKTSIELDDRALADVVTDRRRLQRELGDPGQVRSEPRDVGSSGPRADQLPARPRHRRPRLSARA